MTRPIEHHDMDNSNHKYYQNTTVSAAFVSPNEIKSSLMPLVSHLAQYDSLRLKLEQQGGEVSDLQEITAFLNAKFAAVDRYEKHQASLTDQKQLKQMISGIGLGTIHLDIRKQRHGMPVYYLCRIARDYWAEYSFIVEDLYMSPGYVLPDTRFAKLMYLGHESYYLRMSQFRSAVDQLPGNPDEGSEEFVDYLLHEVGRHCLASMWHEDQQAAMVAANHFGLVYFRQAVELLYLCLGGDLCDLRSKISRFKLDFFTRIYPQPALLRFFERLQSIDGRELNHLPQRAVPLFARLNGAFTEFLGTGIVSANQFTAPAQIELTLKAAGKMPSSETTTVTPLYKLLFGNFYQLERLRKTLQSDEAFHRAVRRLEKKSKVIVGNLVNNEVSASSGKEVGRAHEESD